MTVREINRGEDASILMPLVRYAVQSAELFPLLAKLLTVYVISMPANLGGGVIGVSWTKGIAEGIVRDAMASPVMLAEIELRKKCNMEPVDEYLIEKTVIGGLGLVGKE